MKTDESFARMRIDGGTRLFAVFGHPIAHTFSPKIHELFIGERGGNMAYIACHVEPERIGEAIRGAWAMEIAGINLTIPHKETSIPFLCGISDNARRVGAVNTLKRTENGYFGYNTDVYGMQKQLQTGGMHLEGRSVLLLGAGGAARSALAVCQLEGAKEVRVYNRHRERAEALIESYMSNTEGEERPLMRAVTLEEAVGEPHPYVIQTTPAGMHGTQNPLPIEDERFYEGIGHAADAVYRPQDTPFLQRVRRSGGVGVEGLAMLFYQGARSFEIWNGFTYTEETREALKEKFLAWAKEYFA